MEFANEETEEQITRRRSYYMIAIILLVLWGFSGSDIKLWSDSKDEPTHAAVNTTLMIQTTAMSFAQLKNTLALVLWEAIDAFANITYAPNITTTYVGVSLRALPVYT